MMYNLGMPIQCFLEVFLAIEISKAAAAVFLGARTNWLVTDLLPSPLSSRKMSEQKLPHYFLTYHFLRSNLWQKKPVFSVCEIM